jgi:hypothetical protein
MPAVWGGLGPPGRLLVLHCGRGPDGILVRPLGGGLAGPAHLDQVGDGLDLLFQALHALLQLGAEGGGRPGVSVSLMTSWQRHAPSLGPLVSDGELGTDQCMTDAPPVDLEGGEARGTLFP